MSASAIVTESPVFQSIAREAFHGLTAPRKTLAPWLFYDEAGSRLFEEITELPEYYLTRTERGIFTAHAPAIIRAASRATNGSPSPKLTIIELGAGTATKTGILLAEAVRQQDSIVYQPVDVSESALEEAAHNILDHIPGVSVRCQVADYTREALPLNRLPDTRTLALYIGSSIGNFTPDEARSVLTNLRAQLLPGDMLLLGTDLAPGADSKKNEATLLAAYDDAQGVTAAFNRNVLVRLNRDLGTNFDLDRFQHRTCWNPMQSRIEMHLESLIEQQVKLPGTATTPAAIIRFAAHETIHTENSYKFTPTAVQALLKSSGFTSTQSWQDPNHLFAVTLAEAI